MARLNQSAVKFSVEVLATQLVVELVAVGQDADFEDIFAALAGLDFKLNLTLAGLHFAIQPQVARSRTLLPRSCLLYTSPSPRDRG